MGSKNRCNVTHNCSINILSGKEHIRSLESYISNFSHINLATIIGRYYAMDRDNRWERIQKAYDLLISNNGKEYSNGVEAIEYSYKNNITDEFGNHLNQDGTRMGVGLFERGYMIGIEGGKIFNIAKNNSDNGILALTTFGFMQHKINIFDRDKSIPQLRGDYRKGYDRLTNGLFVEQYIGYAYFSNNGLINFNIGFDIAAGFTKMRRDYQYDLMRGDNSTRVDLLFGIRGGWYIPIFKRKSEEFFFE